jgi:hypothetical protein
MKYLRNFMRNFFLLFFDTEELIGIIVKRIPKENFLEALREFVQEEKKAKIGQIMHSISAQKFFMEKVESYEKLLDNEQKNEGDFVIIWDFTSASYVTKTEDNKYEQGEPLCYLSDEDKENFGKLMVYDIEYSGNMQLNENINLIQDLILSSIKDNRLVAVNALHTRLV